MVLVRSFCSVSRWYPAAYLVIGAEDTPNMLRTKSIATLTIVHQSRWVRVQNVLAFQRSCDRLQAAAVRLLLVRWVPVDNLNAPLGQV